MIGVVSQLRAAGYDISLQGDEISLDFVGDDDPDEAVVWPLIEEMKANKGDLIHSLKREALFVVTIGLAIARARDWEDLSAICDRIDMACNLGELPVEQADQLIAAIKTRSREVTESAGDRSGVDAQP